MSISFELTVEDVATRILSFDTIQLHRATARDGTYVLNTSTLLDADETYYTLTDTTGGLDSWYKYRFYNSSTAAASAYSNPFQVQQISRKRVRQRIMSNFRAGMVFQSVASGSTTGRVASNDYRIKTPVYGTGRGKNAYLKKTSGTNSGENRIITTSVPASGYFDVLPVLSSIPADNDEWEWHWLVDPDSFDDAINRGLLRYLFVEKVPIVGVAGDNTYALDHLHWLTQKRQVTALTWTPEGAVVERPWLGGGRWYDIKQDRGSLILALPYLQEGITATLHTLRTADPLYTDDSVLPDHLDLELVAAFGYDEILTWLIEGAAQVTNVDRSGWSQIQKKFRSDTLRVLIEKNAPDPVYSKPSTSTPSSMPRPYTSR